ncbi:MAG: thioredoxin-like domain-containing protein [Melioribacteraceae bacterium]
MKINWIFILIFYFQYNIYAQTITGTILSSSDQKIIRSDIQILSNEPIAPKSIMKSILLASDGNFNIKLSKKGFYYIRFCAVGHQPFEVPFYIENKENVKVSIVLEPTYIDNFTQIKIIGDFNDFSFANNVVEMQTNNNNEYTAIVKAIADTFSYQLVGISKNGNSVNSFQADYYILDSGGDYKSVLKTFKGQNILLKFRKQDFIYSNNKSSIKYESNSTTSEFIYNLLNNPSKKNEEQNYLTQTKKQLIKWFEIYNTDKNDSANYKNLLNIVKPNSPIWSIYPNIFTKVISIYPIEKQINVLEDLIKEHGDETIKPYFIMVLLQTAAKINRNEIIEEYYNIFERDYKNSIYFEMVRSQFSSDRVIQLGKKIPYFSLPAIDDSTLIFNSENMGNGIYLIDFWATWCAPCVGEMKYLHEANDKFKAKGLKIISISLDFNLDDVLRFRKNKWALPWFNAFIKYDQNNKIIKDFEITQIPKTILVNKSNKIIATDFQLRGESLINTLENIFNN